MKKIILLFALIPNLLLTHNSSLTAQVAEWIAPEAGMGIGVDTDPFENTYTCGQIVGTTTIGPYVFTSNGAQDIVIEKHNMNGSLLWATQFGGAGGEFSGKVLYDGFGGVWVTGQFSGSMNVGSFTLVSAGGNDVFIVKLDASNGAVLFAERAGGSGNDSGLDIETDNFGSIYISGGFSSVFNYPGITINGLGTYNVYMLQIDNFGNGIMGLGITSASIISTWSTTIDNAGNIYFAGHATGTSINFNGTILSMGTSNKFFAKFNSAGVLQWKTDAYFNGEIYGLSVDASENLYFTGNFDSNATFGSFVLTNGANDNIILGKLDISGNYVWAKHYGGTGNDQGFDLKCKSNGELFLTGGYSNSFSFGSLPVSGGGIMRGYIVKLDSAGNELWVQTAHSTTTSLYCNGIKLGISDNIYITGPSHGFVSMAGDTATVNQSFLIHLTDNANVMEGFVFSDINNDGVKDAGEPGIPNVILQLDGSYYSENSGSDGKYNMYTSSGTHTVEIPNLPLYYTLTTPLTQTANFAGMGNTDTSNHFGLFPVANVNDLQIDITPVTSVKAGYVLDYLITCKNVGTTSQNTTVTLQADGILTYVSASPAQTTINGSILTWNTGILNPGQIVNIHALFSIPSSTSIGVQVVSTATIDPVAGDTTASNNTMSNTAVVTGPYDPNYKTVNIDTLWDITGSGWLEYLIHFQNVGNDTAYNVIIIDTLSSYLDISTFEILAKSHTPLNFSIHNGNIVDFRFENIYLPDSSTDQTGSNGFIKFRVKYFASLPVNSTIENFVDIYFDYNAPVRTNTASTIHLSTNALQENSTVRNEIRIFPNPSSSDFTIESADLFIESLRVYTIDGRLISEKSDISEKRYHLNLRSENGIYLIEMEYTDGQKEYQTIVLKK
jgi:hypothetical protein